MLNLLNSSEAKVFHIFAEDMQSSTDGFDTYEEVWFAGNSLWPFMNTSEPEELSVDLYSFQKMKWANRF